MAPTQPAHCRRWNDPHPFWLLALIRSWMQRGDAPPATAPDSGFLPTGQVELIVVPPPDRLTRMGQ